MHSTCTAITVQRSDRPQYEEPATPGPVDVPEARVLHAALTEPYRLTAGQALAELDPADFLARPEYGPVLRVQRYLTDRDGPQCFDLARFAAAAEAHGYGTDLADLAERIVLHAPVAWNVSRLASTLRDRRARFDRIVSEMDALGITFDGVGLPTEPTIQVPPEPLTRTFASDDRVSLEGLSLEVLDHSHDALDACDHPMRVAIHRAGQVHVTSVPCGLRTCSGCGSTILERITAPITAAGTVYAATVDEDDRSAIAQRIRRAGEDAKWIPQPHGQVLVVSTHPVGPTVAQDALPALLSEAFAQVPAGRKITTTGTAWTHSAGAKSKPTEDATVLGYVRVSHLAERNAGRRITGADPEEHPDDAALPPPKRRRTYRAPDAATVEALCRAWKVLPIEEARALAAEARALRELDAATARIVAAHREAA